MKNKPGLTGVGSMPLLCEKLPSSENKKHPKCLGERDYWGEYDCGYETDLTCDDCKYGVGRKNPEAKCNRNT